MSYYRHGPSRPSGPGIAFGVPRVTPFIKLIMITCGVVWFLQFALLRFVDLSQYLGLVPAKFYWAWQPVTYMFLHSPLNPFHLVFNMLMLWMFGTPLERQWGTRTFLRYYFICGLGAAIPRASIAAR